MPLDPILEPILDDLPQMPEDIDDFHTWRREEAAAGTILADQVAEPAPDGANKEAVQIPVEGGTIDLHIFTRPPPAAPRAPLLDGGGWFAGSIKHKIIDITCTERAVGADCVVVAVEYRKAPEHKFPTGLNDCYGALLWVAEHAEDLGIRRNEQRHDAEGPVASPRVARMRELEDHPPSG